MSRTGGSTHVVEGMPRRPARTSEAEPSREGRAVEREPCASRAPIILGRTAIRPGQERVIFGNYLRSGRSLSIELFRDGVLEGSRIYLGAGDAEVVTQALERARVGRKGLVGQLRPGLSGVRLEISASRGFRGPTVVLDRRNAAGELRGGATLHELAVLDLALRWLTDDTDINNTEKK